jgi:hypothetical protein
MTPLDKPEFIPNAPGHVWRFRNGFWIATWQCRTDLAKRGFRPTVVPLWRSETDQPTDDDKANIAAQCEIMQAAMLRWANDDLIATQEAFDGTVRSLIHCYRTDPDSTFKKNRYSTRLYYGSLCRRIEADLGDRRIEEIDARTMLRTHEAWQQSGISMAHSLVGMFRGLLNFGATLLKSDACKSLSFDLSKMRFQMGKSREERLTAEQAIAIREKAREAGFPSIALAQALQFECMLRQRDVIGEWVPMSEPGASDIKDKGRKWHRGIRWSEIDANLILRHVTSKRQKMVEHDLSVAGMVQEELAYMGERKNFGPVIVSEATGLPWRADTFREKWRQFATAAGVPKNVRNMDSRAGGITEATEAGADLEHIKHAAAHSDIAMTQRYSRGAADKTRGVAVLRAEFRKNKGGT